MSDVPSQRRVVIHSGAFKTATSAVQTALFAHAPHLLQHERILVPRTFSRALQGVEDESARSHNRLGHMVRSLRRGEEGAVEKLEEHFSQLVDEFDRSGAETAVLSTEMLTNIDRDSAARIRHCLGAFDLRIVYSVRRVDEYIDSYTRQQLKFKDAIEAPKTPYESPFGGVLCWAEVVGDDAMRVLVYGHPNRSTAVADTLSAIGITDVDSVVGENPVRNPSLRAEGLLVRRAMSRLCSAMGRDPGTERLREAVVQAAYTYQQTRSSTKPLRLYDREQRLAMFDDTRQVHEMLAKRFLTSEQARTFLDRDAIAAMPDDPAVSWTEEEVLGMVEHVGDFLLEVLAVGGDGGESELARVRREFRISRRRNAQFRERIQQLEAELANPRTDKNDA